MRGQGCIAPNLRCKSKQTVSNCIRDPREIDKGGELEKIVGLGGK